MTKGGSSVVRIEKPITENYPSGRFPSILRNHVISGSFILGRLSDIGSPSNAPSGKWEKDKTRSSSWAL